MTFSISINDVLCKLPVDRDFTRNIKRKRNKICETSIIEIVVSYIPDIPSPQKILVEKSIQKIWETYLREKNIAIKKSGEGRIN